MTAVPGVSWEQCSQIDCWSFVLYLNGITYLSSPEVVLMTLVLCLTLVITLITLSLLNHMPRVSVIVNLDLPNNVLMLVTYVSSFKLR